MPSFPNMPGTPAAGTLSMPGMPSMPGIAALSAAGLGGAAAMAASDGNSPAWPPASFGAGPAARGAGFPVRAEGRRASPPWEAPTDLDRAFQYRGEGMAWASVAGRLNDQGSTIHGAPWTADLLRATLSWERRRRHFERMGGELPLDDDEAPASSGPEVAGASPAWPRELA
jgi:hypothetical protein